MGEYPARAKMLSTIREVRSIGLQYVDCAPRESRCANILAKEDPVMNDPRPVSAPTRELAAWVSRLRYADLPARTRETVRLALLDTLGCGVYGYVTPWARTLLKWAQAGAGKAEATVWTCDFSFDYVKINAEYRT